MGTKAREILGLNRDELLKLLNAEEELNSLGEVIEKIKEVIGGEGLILTYTAFKEYLLADKQQILEKVIDEEKKYLVRLTLLKDELRKGV